MRGNRPERAELKRWRMGSKQILVVDDDVRVRSLIEALLQSAGHRVYTASDGILALAQLRVMRFDLVLTDYHMPKLGGPELIAQIRSIDRTLPIAIITGGIPRDVTDHLGCPVLHKPFTASQLRLLVERVVLDVSVAAAGESGWNAVKRTCPQDRAGKT